MGTLSFGENADANQTFTVASAPYDIPLSTQSAVRSTATPTAAAPASTSPSLAATGGQVPTRPVTALGLLLLVLGGGVLLRGRRRTGA